MGAQFSSSLEYPIKPSLDFLADPNLFFSQLPKDIGQYVLTPYLLSGTSREPVNQRWTAPMLVSCFTAKISGLTILQNGDILYCDDDTDRWIKISPTNLHPPITLYDENNTVLPSGKTLDFTYDYDYKSDTLFVTEELGNEEYKIANLCQIDTMNDFVQALIPERSQVPIEESLVTWSPNYQGLEVKRGDQVIFSHPFPVTGDQSCNQLLYYGGYCIINTILDSRHDNTNVIQIYRMLQ